jgi:hypothetical protein
MGWGWKWLQETILLVLQCISVFTCDTGSAVCLEKFAESGPGIILLDLPNGICDARMAGNGMVILELKNP